MVRILQSSKASCCKARQRVFVTFRLLELLIHSPNIETAILNLARFDKDKNGEVMAAKGDLKDGGEFASN